MNKIPLFFKLLLILIATFQLSSLYSQTCGTDIIHQKLLRQNSIYQNEWNALQLQIKNNIASQSSQRGGFTLYTIPVAVHVVHLGEAVGAGSNISDAQVQGAIDGLNDRWRNLIGNSVDIGIEFCLAVRDPNGNPTSGINRVNGSGVPDYTAEGIEWDESGGADEIAVKSLSIWPRDQYYNIWVVHNIYGSVAGYANYPTTYVYEGTVIEDNYMTSGSTVLAHELGHAFSLRHTFEGDNNGANCPVDTTCASNGDLICDTPPHKRGDCGSSNPCTAVGTWDNSRFNYMSYCGSTDRFTANQQVRAEAAVNSSARITLQSSLGCATSTCAQVCSDSDPCTLNLCVSGNCSFQAMNCDDGSACTFDSCGQFDCINIFVGCNDNDPCTVDYCSGNQCINDTMNCNDGNPCTIDYCDNGDCMHDIVSCDDSDPCTDDICAQQIVSILVDYDAADEDLTLDLGGDYFRDFWTLNSNFNENVQGTSGLQWAAMRFNWLDDFPTFQQYLYNENDVTIDSVELLFAHQNITGTPDTIIITVYAEEGIGGGGLIINYQNNDNILNPVLYADTIITTSSLTANLSTPEFLTVRPDLTLQQGQQFIAGVHFYGSTLNTFKVVAGFGNLCSGNCGAYPSLYDVNSFWKIIYWIGSINLSGVNNLYYECNGNSTKNPENCELFEIQNYAISAYLTLKSEQEYQCVHLPISCTANISGALLSEQGNPIPGAIVKLSGSETQTDTTGNDGVYSFEVAQGADVNVISSYKDTITSNCVTTIDLVRMQRHTLVIDTLASRYKIMAADVNVSGAVSAIDIANGRSVILSNATTFPNGRLWRFVPSDFVFPDTLHPFPYDTVRTYDNLSTDTINQNFIGIKLGDVNNSWDVLNPRLGIAGEVQFAMDEYSALPDEEITIAVKVKDFSGISGYQYTLSWNPEVLSFLEVNNKSIQGYYGTTDANRGFLTTSWNDATGGAQSLNDEAVVFELKFKVVGVIGSFSTIKIGSELTQSESYNDNLELLSINSTNGMVNVGDATGVNTFQSASGGWNLSVQPNPFNNTTNILFTVPKDETVSIVIYDLLGKEVKHIESNYPAGEHKIEWEGDDKNGIPLSAGLYHIRLKAGNETQGVKVALVR